MKDKITAGTNSYLDRIFIRDVAQTTTVAGLANQSSVSGIVWYYSRKGDVLATPVTMVSGVIGSYTSFNPTAPTGAPTLTIAATTGGSIPNGTYYGVWTYTANGGRTTISSISGPIATTGTNTCQITFPTPTFNSVTNSGVTGWQGFLGTTSGTPFYAVGLSTYSGGIGGTIGVNQTIAAYNLAQPNPPAATTVSGGGFIAVDNTNMPGIYEISLPNHSIGSGYPFVDHFFKGTSIPQIPARVELDNINYQGPGHVVLASGGLELIQAEIGINVRQAFAPMLAALAGLGSGLDVGLPKYYGANNPSTKRIDSVTDSYGNRTTVTLTLPA